MEIMGALIAGGFIGAVLGFVGAGGAMLSVPILMYLFDFTPHHATTAALAVVFIAALSGAIPKIRKREILYRDALVIWAIGLTANLGFSSISDSFSDTFIKSGFALVLLFAGTSMLRSPFTDTHTRMPIPKLIFISLLIGSMTGIFGIGGGFLAIPVLVLFFGTPHNIAAGTSLLIISLNSVTALLGHLQVWHEIAWHIPATMAVSAVVVASIASHVGSASNPAKLRKAFAFLLFAIAGFTLLQVLLQS
ncbi:MAG: sulfite exporter TauE/SafE family protein [Candidatus Planktophila sp.]